jgi:hypothetical protein
MLASAAEKALEYGENKGGFSVGLKSGNGIIVSITDAVNPDLPSRFGNSDDEYDLYANLKCITALRTEQDSKRLEPEKAPLKAIHPGAIIFWFEDTLVSIAYSGHHAKEDVKIARMIKDEFFPG